MTPRDLTAVLLAVLAVYLLGDAITQASTAAFFLSLDAADEFLRETHNYQGRLAILVFGVQLCLALALLFLSRRIAARLFPDPEPSQPHGQSSLPELQAAAFSVLGAYFLIKAIATFTQAFAPFTPHDSVTDLWPSYAGTLAQGILGLGLVLGARVASGAWFLARRAGRDR